MSGIIHLNSDYSNIPDFIDSLFEPSFRSRTNISAAIESKKLSVFFSREDSEKILNVWLAAWQEAQGDPYDATEYSHCPDSDKTFLAALSSFLKDNGLVMYVPTVSHAGTVANSTIPIYELNREANYAKSEFWTDGSANYGTVSSFLELFMCGAHFVLLQSSRDLPAGVSVPAFFLYVKNNNSLKPLRDDPGNSHYTSLTNRCGLYYPSIDQNTAPNPCPFIVSFLVCPTVSRLLGCDAVTNSPDRYSTFFQLEGWQALAQRHMADKDTYDAYLWNVSTFGACAYSEKRATTIFLAPPEWVPTFNTTTFMAPYVGAETPQHWLKEDAVQLSSDAARTTTFKMNNCTGKFPLKKVDAQAIEGDFMTPPPDELVFQSSFAVSSSSGQGPKGSATYEYRDKKSNDLVFKLTLLWDHPSDAPGLYSVSAVTGQVGGRCERNGPGLDQTITVYFTPDS